MDPAIGFLSEAEGKSLLLKTLHTQNTGLGLLGVHLTLKPPPVAELPWLKKIGGLLRKGNT